MSLKIVQVNHITIAAPVGEHDAVDHFYGKIMGLKKINPPSNLTASYDVWWYELGDKVLHIDFSPPFVKVFHNRHFCIEVEDIHEARQHFHHHNIETRGDVDVPAYERFHVDDPFGNGIEFVSPRK